MKQAYRVVVLGVVGLACVLSVRADPTRPMLLETEASETLLETGREHLFAFRMEAAERTFRTLQARPDGAEAAYHHLAMVALFKGLVTDERDHFETFMARSDTLKQLLNDQPASNWRRQLEAMTNLQRAVAAGKLERYVRAGLAARSAYNGFNALVRDAPEFDEAYLGMGLLHLTVASLPSGWRDLLSVLGFRGTAEQGMQELERAAQQSRYNQELAHMSLAVADILFNQEVERATERLARLYERDPQSLLFAHLYGFALYTNRQAEEAQQVLQAATEQGDAYFYIDYLDYYLAETYFVQDAFAEAERYYRRYLTRHEGPALRAMGLFRLGLALEMQQQRQAAVQIYRRVDTARDFDSDLAAQRWAEEHLERPMSALDRKLVRGENAFLSGRYEEAERILHAAFEAADATAEQQAKAAFYVGWLNHVQQQYERAHPAYYFAIQHPGDPRAQWGPWSQLHLGDMYAEQGRTAEAIQAYEAALDYEPPFDYHQSLEQRARIALERLRE